MVAASGLFLHQMKQRSDKASDTFDPDAVHDATIVSEMRRSMKSIFLYCRTNTSDTENEEECSSLRDVSEEIEEQTEVRADFAFKTKRPGI